MKVLLQVIFWVAMVGSVTSSIYCGMVLAAAARFGLRKRREQSAVADFLPAVSMLKPLHGTEPGMERNIASFFEQEYPGEWELLFCARFDTDEGLKLARAVGQRYPQVDARYVTCGEPTPKFHNAKVYSLAKMDSVAKNEWYVTSDADVRVEKDYLLRMVQNLKDPHIGDGELHLSGDGAAGYGEWWAGVCVAAGCGGEECGDELGCAGGGHAGGHEVCAGRDDGGARRRASRRWVGSTSWGSFMRMIL